VVKDFCRALDHDGQTSCWHCQCNSGRRAKCSSISITTTTAAWWQSDPEHSVLNSFLITYTQINGAAVSHLCQQSSNSCYYLSVPSGRDPPTRARWQPTKITPCGLSDKACNFPGCLPYMPTPLHLDYDIGSSWHFSGQSSHWNGVVSPRQHLWPRRLEYKPRCQNAVADTTD